MSLSATPLDRAVNLSNGTQWLQMFAPVPPLAQLLGAAPSLKEVNSSGQHKHGGHHTFGQTLYVFRGHVWLLSTFTRLLHTLKCGL